MSLVDDILGTTGAPSDVSDILGGSMPSPSPVPTPTQTAMPSQSVDDILGLSTAQSADPWENFTGSAKRIISSRGLPATMLPVLLGQASLESARGKSAPGNNYFGIKGRGSAGSNNLATKEYNPGSGYYGTQSDFAAYNTPDDSIHAYLNLVLKYPGVMDAVKNGRPIDILTAIRRAGYATSPTYIQNVANTPEFRQYDTMR